MKYLISHFHKRQIKAERPYIVINGISLDLRLATTTTTFYLDCVELVNLAIYFFNAIRTYPQTLREKEEDHNRMEFRRKIHKNKQ